MQDRIRKIPNAVDAVLSRHAQEQRDLDDIAGTWHEDLAFDHELAAQDAIDAELWT